MLRLIICCICRSALLCTQQIEPSPADDSIVENIVYGGDNKVIGVTVRQSASRVRLTELSRFPDLIDLTLAGVSLKDSDLGVLLPMKSLKSLDLTDTSITDDGLRILSDLTSLERLTIQQNTRISNTGIAWVSKLRGLRFLDASHTKIDDAGLIALKLSRLEVLLLSGTHVDGTFLEGASFTRSLRKLDISSTAVQGKALELLALSRDLTELNISDCGGLQPEDFVHLSRLQGLRVLDASWTELDGQRMSSMRFLEHLEDLNIRGCEIVDDDLLPLRNCRSLGRLDISRTPCTFRALGPIGDLESIQELDCFDIVVPSGELGPLLKLSALRQLSITLDSPGPSDLAALVKMRSLETLSLALANVDSQVVGTGRSPKNLTTLVLYSSQFDDRGMSWVAGMDNLRDLQFHESLVTRAGLLQLRVARRLRFLLLANCHLVTPDDVRALKIAMPLVIISQFATK